MSEMAISQLAVDRRDQRAAETLGISMHSAGKNHSLQLCACTVKFSSGMGLWGRGDAKGREIQPLLEGVCSLPFW